MASLFKVRGIQVAGETTFGTAGSNYTTMRCEEGSDIQPEQTALENAIAKAGDYQLARIIGGKRGQATTIHKIHGWTSSAVAAAPSRTEADNGGATAFDMLLAILASACGNVYSGGYITGTTVSKTGSPTNAITASGGAELTSFQSGQAVVWATGTTRRAYEMGWLTSNSAATPDSAGLLQNPRRDPQGSTIWGSHNIFVRDLTPYHDSGTVTSFSLKFVGHDAADVVTAVGCQPVGVKISATVNQVPTIEITWAIAHWTMPGSGGGPSVPSWSFPEPQAALDWQVSYGGSSDPVYNPTVKSIELDLGLTRVALEGGHSDSGVEGMVATMRRPKATMQWQWTIDAYNDFAAQTATPLSFQHGTAPGRMFGWCMPAARLVSFPKRSELDGVAVVDMEFEACLYTGDSGSDLTKPVDSPLKLAFA